MFEERKLTQPAPQLEYRRVGQSPLEPSIIGQRQTLPSFPRSDSSSLDIQSHRLERELQRAIAQAPPSKRQEVGARFLTHLAQKGENQSDLLQQLKLSSTSPERMSIEDLSELAIYAYHTHPEVFQLILIQPGVIEFLSNSLLITLLGILASRWLNEPDR